MPWARQDSTHKVFHVSVGSRTWIIQDEVTEKAADQVCGAVKVAVLKGEPQV